MSDNSMREAFQSHIKTEFSELFQKKLLVAVSGGIDSVVLAHLCKSAKLDFALAHVNFKLRGQESDGDADFVQRLGEELGVKVYVKICDTQKIAERRRQSIQITARELRYNWFNKLCDETGYDFILTAHHQNDSIETFFINLLRGTGLTGLTGIPSRNRQVIRPLLRFSRESIADYAKKKHINWREDRTNAGEAYRRNRLRHHLVPELKKERSDFQRQFQKTQDHLTEAADLIADYKKHVVGEVAFKKGEYTYFDIAKLKRLPHLKALLYQVFKPCGFSSGAAILDLCGAQPGKVLLTEGYRLLKDRDHLILGPDRAWAEVHFKIYKQSRVINFPKGKIICENVTHVTGYKKEKAYIAAEKIRYPLMLRRWKPGDIFQPFGMKGHKKVSDFLKDEKLSLFEKETTWVLLSGQDIVWVVGFRIDDKFKVEKNTANILKLELLK